MEFFCFRGDLKAIRRIAIEFCQDVVANGVLYVEARFCPHLMLSESVPEVTARHVVQTVLDGFKEAETQLGLKVFFLGFFDHFLSFLKTLELKFVKL